MEKLCNGKATHGEILLFKYYSLLLTLMYTVEQAAETTNSTTLGEPIIEEVESPKSYFNFKVSEDQRSCDN